jgi:hypothetical protein
MINKDKLKRSQALKIIKLLEQHTRAEIFARLVPFRDTEYADYYTISLEKMDELREYIFGSSNLVILGKKWGILKTKKKLKRNMRRR